MLIGGPCSASCLSSSNTHWMMRRLRFPFPQRSVHVKGLDQMINQMGQAQKLLTTKD